MRSDEMANGEVAVNIAFIPLQKLIDNELTRRGYTMGQVGEEWEKSGSTRWAADTRGGQCADADKLRLLEIQTPGF